MHFEPSSHVCDDLRHAPSYITQSMMKSAVFCLCLLFSSAPIRGLSSGDLQLELASVVNK